MKKLSVLFAILLTTSISAFSAIGNPSTDLVYVPLTPCRIVDTRFATNQSNLPIPANSTRNFWGWPISPTTFAPQGGNNSDCGLNIGTDIAALAVNFTVVTPATGGYITAFPYGFAQPVAATVNFNAGEVKGNFSVMKISQTGGSFDFSIYSTSATHLVIDVVGYYARPRP